MGHQMTLFVVAVLLVLAYPIVAAALLRATQGTRDEIALLAHELLASPQISEEKKQFISDLVDDVFDWRFMAIACVQFPVSVWSAMRGKLSLSREDKRFIEDDRVARFIDLHMRAVAAAAPLWTLLFIVIAAISIIVAVSFVGFSVVSQLWLSTAEHVTVRVQTVPFHRAINGH